LDFSMIQLMLNLAHQSPYAARHMMCCSCRH